MAFLRVCITGGSQLLQRHDYLLGRLGDASRSLLSSRARLFSATSTANWPNSRDRTEDVSLNVKENSGRNKENGADPTSASSERYKDEGFRKTNQEYDGPRSWQDIAFKAGETAAITAVSVIILASAGYLYHIFYRRRMLSKMAQAFEPGDPELDLVMHARTEKGSNPKDFDFVKRPQQALIDDVVKGDVTGRYYLLIGEKGTGKMSMVLEGVRKTKGQRCAVMDAHADPEVFRLRLGKALNFSYHEDYIGSLFSLRGPRDTTAILDIERAFDVLEQVALIMSDQNHRRGRTRTQNWSPKDEGHCKPLVLVISSLHLLRDDDNGRNLLELLQQKAERLAASKLVTIIFCSDDYWVFERLRRQATRLDVLSVRDLERCDATKLLKSMRRQRTGIPVSDNVANKVFDMLGGRPQHISLASNAVPADAPDASDVAHELHGNTLLQAARSIVETEKSWFLSQCPLLGEEMDDDVMNEGKFSVSAHYLLNEFVKLDKQQRQGEKGKDRIDYLPQIPLWKAKRVMTRSDFIQLYDNLNLFTISNVLDDGTAECFVKGTDRQVNRRDLGSAYVRPDSAAMMQAFREIAGYPDGYDEPDSEKRKEYLELLDQTANRVSAIESLGRTRELVMKDLVLGTDGNGPGEYSIQLRDSLTTKDHDTNRKEIIIRYKPHTSIEHDE